MLPYLRLVVGAAELVERHVLAGDVLDDVGAGDEHVALVADRDDEVGLDRRVDGTARALAEDDRDLRHQAGQQLVAAAQLGVPGQRRRGVLDAGAAGVVDADDRAADHGHPLHQPGDLAAEHLSDGALEHRLVVAEHADRAAVDGGVAGDHAVAEQCVRIAGSLRQRTDLEEAAGIDQGVNARAGARNALLVPLGGGLLTTGFLGQLQLLAEFGQLLRGGGRAGGWVAEMFRGHSRSRSFDPVDRLAHVRADLGNVRLVDGLDVLAPDGHDLEVLREFAPAAVGLAGGVGGLERDRVVVVPIGHVEHDVAVVRLDVDGVEGPVVQVRRALMLDDAAGDLHAALADHVEHELHLTGVVERLEVLVRDLGDLAR